MHAHAFGPYVQILTLHGRYSSTQCYYVSMPIYVPLLIYSTKTSLFCSVSEELNTNILMYTSTTVLIEP